MVEKKVLKYKVSKEVQKEDVENTKIFEDNLRQIHSLYEAAVKDGDIISQKFYGHQAYQNCFNFYRYFCRSIHRLNERIKEVSNEDEKSELKKLLKSSQNSKQLLTKNLDDLTNDTLNAYERGFY